MSPFNLMSIEPYDMVKGALPFDLYPFQVKTVNELAELPRAGYYLDMGLGKTMTSIASALYKLQMGCSKVLVLMPPILIPGWARVLDQVKGVSHLAYRGTPTERKAMKLDADFILMSYQIFKRDHDRFMAEFENTRLVLIADEAVALKNIGSENHKKFVQLTPANDTLLLTGTPLSKPEDAYAYCKLIAPGLYRNMHHFENVHVASRDFFGNIEAYRNLDLLAENMTVNAVRLRKEDVLKDLPPITHTPLYYDLAPDHYKLYKQLAEEQLLLLESGGKIDATTPQKLNHALGQVVVNYDHFAGDPTKAAAALELLDEIMDELGDKKLIVFTNYRMTNRMLQQRLKKYNAVAVFGDISRKEQDKALETFIKDKGCRLIQLQTLAGGVGINGLQDVCSDVLFLEIPTVPMWFHQACARAHRIGQQNPVNVRIAVAEKTCNVRQFNNLLNNDELVGKVIPNIQDLRAMMFGA